MTFTLIGALGAGDAVMVNTTRAPSVTPLPPVTVTDGNAVPSSSETATVAALDDPTV